MIFGIPDDFVVQYLYEQWGRSAPSNAVLEVLGGLTASSTYDEVRSAILAEPDTVGEAISLWVHTITMAYAEELNPLGDIRRTL